MLLGRGLPAEKMSCFVSKDQGGRNGSVVPSIATQSLMSLMPSGCSELQNDLYSPQKNDFQSTAELSQGELKPQTPGNRKGSRISSFVSVGSLLAVEQLGSLSLPLDLGVCFGVKPEFSKE